MGDNNPIGSMSDKKTKHADELSDKLMRELLAKELKEKLSKRIDSNDPDVFNAIKMMISQGDDDNNK
jgi:hypothetical protein